MLAFKALANEARYQIIQVLAADGASHPCQDFIARLGITAPAVSNHLRLLADAGLILTERRGNRLYVSLAATDIAYQMAALVRTPRGGAATGG